MTLTACSGSGCHSEPQEDDSHEGQTHKWVDVEAGTVTHVVVNTCNQQKDFSRSDWADPDIEYVFADGPATGTWKGLSGMADAWRDFLKAGVNLFHVRDGRVTRLVIYHEGERALAELDVHGRGAHADS